MPNAPLAGLRVAAHASGVAAAYAARLLATMGADVTLVEPPEGSALRRQPPALGTGGESAVFAYLAAGMDSFVADPASADGRAALAALLSETDVFIDDTPVEERAARALDPDSIGHHHPQLIHVSVLPFGASGPKASWRGSDLIVQHASGEGNLLPNGLAVEMFPDRAPLKIGGYFGEMQGGVAAALGALSALWARPEIGGQFVDVSSQDAMLAVGAFAIQRLGDGSIEHRVERSFRFGGVIPCADGYVELLTLEQRQWDGLVKLLGDPEWAQDPALADAVERSRRGPQINRHIREWALSRNVDDIVSAGQKLSVPLARYHTPDRILHGAQERHRGLFQPIEFDGGAMLDMLVSPFQVAGEPLRLQGGPPALGQTSRTKETAA